MFKVAKYVFQDLYKSWIIIAYVFLLLLISCGAFMLESEVEKSFLMLMQVTLFVLPLVTLIFTTIYYYNSMEFIVLLLAQPIERSKIISGFFIGIGLTLMLTYLLGIGVPLAIIDPSIKTVILLSVGALLSLAYTSIALYIGISTDDKSRGIGFSLLLWAFFAFLFDGIILFLLYQFALYPIENIILILTFLNPLSIARIMVIMFTSASALFGLAGAVFTDFFSQQWGLSVAYGVLVLWIVIPYLLYRRKFKIKDF